MVMLNSDSQVKPLKVQTAGLQVALSIGSNKQTSALEIQASKRMVLMSLGVIEWTDNLLMKCKYRSTYVTRFKGRSE